LLTDLSSYIQVEQVPKLEGKQIIFTVVPKKK
jgi:translation initiation factor IF-3